MSYLVFSEVKALEKRALEAEQAMASWKDKIDNVAGIEKQLRDALAERDAVKGELRAATDKLDMVQQGVNRNLQFNNPNVSVACGCGESFDIAAS